MNILIIILCECLSLLIGKYRQNRYFKYSRESGEIISMLLLEGYKKLAIMSISTQKGNVAQFIYFLIYALKKVYNEIFIISKYYFSEDTKQKLGNDVEYILENITGTDFDRWRKVLINLNDTYKIDEYSDITFLNDTFYGPVYPLDEIWSVMESKKVDFWGITRHQSIHSADMGESDIDSFIQTYFVNFKIKNVKNDLFVFLEEMGRYSFPEHYLTSHLEKRNYKSDVYVHTERIENSDLNLAESFLLFYPYTLVYEKKCPFISRYLFSLSEEVKQLYGVGLQIMKLLEYINDKYPVEYIYSDLLYQHNMYHLMHSLDLNYIVDFEKKSNLYKSSNKSVIFIYLYYTESFNYYIERCTYIPTDIDIYIYTNTRNKVKTIRKMLDEKGVGATVILVDSKGREWAVFWNEMKKILKKYDYVCFMHDKSFHSFEFPTQAYAFRDLLWENLLPSKRGIYDIIRVLDENAHIGVLVPPIVKHGSYFKYYMNFWTNNFENTLRLAKRLGVRDSLLDPEITPVSIGSMFWFKVKALSLLWNEKFLRKNFPEEPLETDGTINHAFERLIPYVAQEQGYYTGVIMTQQYIKHDWLEQADIIRKMGKCMGDVKNSLYNLVNNN